MHWRARPSDAATPTPQQNLFAHDDLAPWHLGAILRKICLLGFCGKILKIQVNYAKDCKIP